MDAEPSPGHSVVVLGPGIGEGIDLNKLQVRRDTAFVCWREYESQYLAHGFDTSLVG